MAYLPVTVVPRNCFSKDPCNKQGLVACISDIPGDVFGRIYDDACDAGFAIEARDGGLVRFYMHKEERLFEELAGWKFWPVEADARKYPEAAGMEITLFND